MAEQLKEMFNASFYRQLADIFKNADTQFDAQQFYVQVTQNLEHLSLNQRLRNTTMVLNKHLSSDYKKAINTLFKVMPNLKPGYTTLVFPDYVALYGHNHFDVSMEALKYFTTFGSSEFAIREFLKRDFDKTIKVMNKWSTDKNYHVRRLASEGCRPRLPWSFKLDEVIKHPHKTLSILENLKTDTELYVKKSVANHLNDISKDNTAWMLDVLSKWDNNNPHTLWIKKHASRTLIKKGNAASLLLFDFEKKVEVKVGDIKLNNQRIKLGDKLIFTFDIQSLKNKEQKLVVDYVVHYVKKSGETAPKVFKLKEIYLPAKAKLSLVKSHLFKDFTTRKHYAGIHTIEIIINGKSFGKATVELMIKH